MYCIYFTFYQEEQRKNPSNFTAQHARMTVDCAECGKPRVIFKTNRLSERQQITILTGLQEYTCGEHILPPDNTMHKSVDVKLLVNCGDPVQLAYYSSKLGRADICCCCGGMGATQNNALKEKYVKT
jgi:hypothetical protein